MQFSDVLLFYARNGLFEPFRKSAYSKFCRRNRGKEFIVETQAGFKIKTTIGDNVDNAIYVYGAYERGTSEVVRRLSGICKTFVDVGCNIGYYSCLYHRFNPEGRVYAIDPNPEMVRRTSENLDLNSCKKYKVFNFGVSNTSGKLELNVPRHRHSTSSFAYNPSRRDPDMVDRIEVQVAPLEDILSEEVLESALLKVDTEGYEYNVFSGLDPGRGLIFDYIVFEYSGKTLKMTGVEPTSLLGLELFSYYHLYSINEDGSLAARERDDICALEEIAGNFLLVRKDKPACLDFLL
ncbi:MAG: FkbM family methyltransferase [Planctomycetota bacterium]|jgi:FkbM family methyltransferase